MSRLFSQPPQGFCDPRALAGLPADAPMALALSGGADSVALLAMLAGDPHLSALHVHHGIRGAEADRDADFCRALCARLGVPLTVLQIDAPALAAQSGESLETAAREARYAVMSAHLRANGIPLLLTAHHADDLLETLILNLARGTGLNGLCGIPACRPLDGEKGIFVARPVLALTRDALVAYVKQNDLTFVTDSTNAAPFCKRNRLRLEVLPALLREHPHAAANAARCAATLAQDEAYLCALADTFIQEQGKAPLVSALAALPTPIFARVMRRLLPIVPEKKHLDDLHLLCERVKPHASLSLPGVTVRVTDGRLFADCAPAPAPCDYALTLTQGQNDLPGGLGTILVLPHGAPAPCDQRHHTFVTHLSLCSAKIKGALCARPRRAGDRILQGGMHKAVRRLPGLSHLPPAVRARMPLLTDDEGVVALPFAPLRDGVAQNPDLTIFFYFS